MKSITVKLIVVEANMGSGISDCIRDCMEIAVKEWRNVELTHNGKVYSININALFDSVTEGP